LRVLNIGFLASHNGSSMRAIVHATEHHVVKAEAKIVISNNAQSPALEFAREHKIPTKHLSATSLGGQDTDEAIESALVEAGVDTLVLSGYMRKLGPRVLARFAGRILNIHPGLLPRFGGQGMYGMNVHKAVIASGERTSGITIHLVDEEYDHGAQIASRKVLLMPGDTPETLAARVQASEPEFFVEILRKLADGSLAWPDA
jgi:phosphoribosylglycinamide formyltransferase-1